LHNQVKILGYIIDGQELKADPEKIKAILERKELTNLDELQSLLGIENTVRRFMKIFSTIATPLHAPTNFLFELTEPEINCKIKTSKTTDNLYIAFHNENENLEYIKSIKTKSQKIIQ